MEPVETLDLLRRGDARAYRELVAEFRPRLLRAAARLGHPADEAEDLVQDAFVALVRNAGRLEGRASILTWLYRVLLNRHADLLRARAADRSRPARAPDAAGPGDSDQSDRIRRALRLLREPEQRVLFLRFFEGLPYDDIARIVEAPLGSVHSLAFHGLRRLRELLKEEMP